ncbi:MAG: HD domain-containing phosphohydrolase [Chloroflexota bacterium]
MSRPKKQLLKLLLSERPVSALFVVLITVLACLVVASVGLTLHVAALAVVAWTCLIVTRFGPAKLRNVFGLGSALVFVYAMGVYRPAFDGFSQYILWAPLVYAYILPDSWFSVAAGTIVGLPLLWYLGTEPRGVVIGFALSMLTSIAAWTAAFRLVRRLRQERERYRLLSIVDSLTQVYTLNHTMELGQSLLAAGRSVTAIVIDLRQFHEINETFGHAVGDDVLVEFARRLSQEALRYSADSVTGRLGGDEFVVIVPDRDEAAAVKLAAELRASLAAARFRADPDLDTVPLRLSLGFACGRAPATIQAILHEADQSMYYDKYEHDSRWNLFGGDKPQPSPEYMPRLQSLAEKDMYTFVHSQLVSQLAAEFARSLGLDNDIASDLALAGWLHDFGKILIPSAILRKPGPLTDAEFDLVRRHVNDSLDLLQSLYLSDTASKAIKLHHERWDGKGYPAEVGGERTPVEGRIMQICDAFSAMTVKRLYRKPLSIGDALREIERNAGSQFDPELARAFVTFMIQRRPNEAAAVRQILMPKPAVEGVE